jgi:hypothetical protein
MLHLIRQDLMEQDYTGPLEGEVEADSAYIGGQLHHKVGGQLQNTPPGSRAALKQLQPFYGVPMTDPFRHPLRALYVLNNRDKHRSLNLIARAATIRFVDVDRKKLFQGLDFPLRSFPAEGDERHTPAVFLTVPAERTDVDAYLLATEQVSLHHHPN